MKIKEQKKRREAKLEKDLSVPLVETVHKACCESGIHQYCTNIMTDEQPSKYIMAFARKLLNK